MAPHAHHQEIYVTITCQLDQHDDDDDDEVDRGDQKEIS